MTLKASPPHQRTLRPSHSSGSGGGTLPVLELVSELCAALAAEGIRYCHWKSNEAIDRSGSGDNDLDLLVRRSDFTRFLALLNRFGFKEARPPAVRELPGVLHYYGLDRSGRLVHVHTQAHLILGDDMTKNYRLPIEEAYLASSRQDGVFVLPSADYELAVFVVRMVLKHATWDALLYRRGELAPSERRELDWLQARATADGVRRVVREHLPFISPELWERCTAILQPGAAAPAKVVAARRLRAVLAGNGRYGPSQDTALRVWRRASWGTRRYVLRLRTRKQLVNGGAIVAIVGGDGAGKSSAVAAVTSMLGKPFATRQLHLGKPPRSLTSLVVKGPLYVGRRFGLFGSTRLPAWESVSDTRSRPTYSWLLWHLLNARDRHRLYAKARRISGQGGLVVCDRFPLPELRLMDGARTTSAAEAPTLSRAARWLVARERQYYARIGTPDVLVVLRLDPEIAVSRRHDEPEHFVRVRNQEVFDADWSGTTAVVVDAEQPQSTVLSEILTAVWARL